MSNYTLKASGKTEFLFNIYSSQHLNNAVCGKEVTEPGVKHVDGAINVDVAQGVILRHAIDNQLTGRSYHYDHKGTSTIIVTKWTNPIGVTIYIAASCNLEPINQEVNG